MARKRDLKPSFFIDADLADCGAYAMLAFAGLWCHADRDGRMKDQPRELKVKILPYFDVDFDDVLNDLDNGDFISRYEVDGKRYIQVENFTAHQNPHPKEPSLGLPANPHGCADPCKEIAKQDLQPSRADADAKGVRGKSVGGEGSSAGAREGYAVFAAIWENHPIKGKIDDAKAAFYKHVEPDQFEAVMAQHKLWVASWDDPAFVPDLHRWFKNWTDAPRPAPKSKSVAQVNSRELTAEAQLAKDFPQLVALTERHPAEVVIGAANVLSLGKGEITPERVLRRLERAA